jgi:FTR1 family protein
VLAAILAFLRNTGQQSAVRSVNVGWGLALLAGLGTWALAAYVIDVSGSQRELLEGATALFASVMVLWLGVWMHDRRHAAAWQDYIKSSLVGGGGRFGFAILAFFSVYRELFEVILFYETLWLQAGPAGHDAVLAGGATALVLLVGLAWVILRGSAKLPLALFFSINAALLCALSVVFAGHGVKALQEAGIFGTRPVAFFEFDWLGIHADAYSLSAQAVAIVAITVLYGRSWLAEKRRVTVSEHSLRHIREQARSHSISANLVGASLLAMLFGRGKTDACLDRCRRLPRAAKDLVVKFALKRQFEVVLVAGQPQIKPGLTLVKLIVVPSGPDAADDYLVEHAVPGELVICSDVPLADRLVKKGVAALDPRGKEFDAQNMGDRLAVRNLFTDLREQGRWAAARHRLASGKSRRLPMRWIGY